LQILQTLKKFLEQIPENSRVIIAYSGGVDSHVLLHAIALLRSEFPSINLLAIYINHGLLSSADDWAKHCEKICKKLKIDFKKIKIHVDQKTGESLEAQARIARYEAFLNLMQKQDYLVTAHHQDDQAETCLLQFLRGAGPKGLAAMPEIISFGKGCLIRPFLSISRQEILDYAKENKLSWIEDDSNHDTKFTRNFLRYEIMPLLRQRWPSVCKTIMRVSQYSAEADQLLQEFAKQDLKSLGNQDGTLNIIELKKLSFLRQKNSIRVWLHEKNYLLPSAIKLDHIIHDVIYAKEDAMPCVSWGNIGVRRFQNKLYVMKILLKHDAHAEYYWEELLKPFELPNGLGTLYCELVDETCGHPTQLIAKNKITLPLKIKFRCGGESCYLPGHKIKLTLKNLFQEWKIPPWERDRIPLIYINDELAVIVGYAVCQGFAAQRDEKGYRIFINE